MSGDLGVLRDRLRLANKRLTEANERLAESIAQRNEANTRLGEALSERDQAEAEVIEIAAEIRELGVEEQRAETSHKEHKGRMPSAFRSSAPRHDGSNHLLHSGKWLELAYPVPAGVCDSCGAEIETRLRLQFYRPEHDRGGRGAKETPSWPKDGYRLWSRCPKCAAHDLTQTATEREVLAMVAKYGSIREVMYR